MRAHSCARANSLQDPGQPLRALHQARSGAAEELLAVHDVDGQQFFSRPGPRLVESAEWLAGILEGVRAGA